MRTSRVQGHGVKVQRSTERGQATVEYVGLAVAVLLVAIGGGLGSQGDKLGTAVAKRLQSAIATTK